MQTIGERLEEARKRKGTSIREAAEATKIRGEYLHKFESSQFDIQLPEIYVRGFLRIYSNYLKLSPDKIVNDYLALGLDEARATRAIGREFYGRMDLGTASSTPPIGKSGKPGEDLAPSSHEVTEAPAPRSGNPATFVPRSHGHPPLNKALLIKGGLALVAAIALVAIIILMVQTLMTSKSDTATPVASVQAMPEQTVTIVALNTVRIKVVQEFDGKELFQGTLVRGESRQFPKTGSLFLTASALENVEIELAGKRHPTGMTGYNRVRIN